MKRAKSRLRGAFGVLLLVSGCAAQQYIERGDALLKEGKFKEAISSYEEALRLAPDSGEAQEGVRKARRAAVRRELRDAKEALSKGEFALALGQASKARRMPLDLDDTELARRIDETIDQSARGAEERVRAWAERGQMLSAVELAEEVVAATPGTTSRRQWADGVRQEAIGHYTRLAEELSAQGLLGSAAMQLAMAKKVGAPIDVTRVVGLWNRFAEPICFALPNVRVTGDALATAAERVQPLIDRIQPTAQAALDELRGRCGEGVRPLGIEIRFADVTIVDETTTERRARALPGVEIKTEEIYYEEIPETVVEEVTEEEVQTQQVERRDCAPRPGQSGCRVWSEEVETKVPVKRQKEVTRVKRLKKSRPVSEPLPADKVVMLEVSRTTRRVVAKGSIAVDGAGTPRKFELVVDSSDEGHAGVHHPKLTVAPDPLTVDSLAAVLAAAAEQISSRVKDAVAEAVKDWSLAYVSEAKERTRQGQMPQAEELYLRVLALGVGGDAGLRDFFAERYGRQVAQVMGVLSEAMGVAVAEAAPGGGDAASFPKRRAPAEPAGEASSSVDESAAVRTQQMDKTETVSPGNLTTRKATEGFTDEELQALERESLEATVTPSGPTGPGATPASEGGAGPSSASGPTGPSGAGDAAPTAPSAAPEPSPPPPPQPAPRRALQPKKP